MPSYAGENFLQVNLPNYEWERTRLIGYAVVAGILWIVLVPVVLAGFAAQNDGQQSSRVIRIRKGSKSNEAEKKSEAPPTPSTTVSPVYTMLGVLGCMLSFVWVDIKMSPYNQFLPRRVFQAPLLHPSECQRVLDMAARAAARNAANTTDPSMLEPPEGWHKKRHNVYPTTDLNIITDGFDDLDWLGDVLDRRLAPVISRVYGIPRRSL